MKASIQFKNFAGLDHLRESVSELIDHSIGRFEAWHDFDTHVVIGLVRGRTDTHGPIFECELLLKGKGMPKRLFVKRQNADFHAAVRDCFKVSEQILKKTSRERVSKRRNAKYIPVPDVGAA
ncbi:MAG: HPF/RaiA family ribosome-associated protein [Bdellovibrionales bacterium]